MTHLANAIGIPSKETILDEALSRKLRMIGFIAMIFVVYIHSYNLFLSEKIGSQDSFRPLNIFVQTFVSRNICKIAVPFFFAISGFLFFVKIKSPPDSIWFMTQIRKRLRTVLIPYLLWNTLSISVFFLRDQSSSILSTGRMLSEIDGFRLLNELFIHPEISYQLWFLRDLMILVFLSPLIYVCIYRFRWVSLIPLIALWLFDINFQLPNTAGALFFCVGAAVALRVISLPKQLSPLVVRSLLALWLILMLLSSYWSQCGVLWPPGFDQFCILIGLLSVWVNYESTFGVIERFLLPLSSFSFFIYAFHEPLMSIVKTRLITRVGACEIDRLLIFLFLPILVILICLIVGYAMQTFMPRVYELITGGR